MSNTFDYRNYMTIEILQDDTSIIVPNDMQYTSNGTWQSVSAGDVLVFSTGELVSFKRKSTIGSGGTFNINGRCNLKGNCMSLILQDGALGNGEVHPYAFSYLFANNTSIENVDENFLPATTLAYYCYHSMFYGCSSLVTAPTLPATTLVQSCYSAMFCGCSSLNYIKAMFTTVPTSLTTYTGDWVNGVSPTGTFVKNPDATWEVYGDDGIPSGWTVKFDGEQDKKTENYLRKGNTSMAMQVLTLDFPAETDLYVYYTTSMIGSGMLIWPKGHSIHSLGLGPGDSIVSVDRIEPNEDDFYIYKIAY